MGVNQRQLTPKGKLKQLTITTLFIMITIPVHGQSIWKIKNQTHYWL